MKLIECPRDAMQGIRDFIPTDQKIAYINQLLKVGFDTIDFGSFVSPKAIPQMRDTAEVLEGLNLEATATKLLAIVANLRGSEQVAQFKEIHYQGFPLSLSETFQQRNTNKSITGAMEILKGIQDNCVKANQTLVTYLSMGFGNPYGDPWSPDFINDFIAKLDEIGVTIISLADTIGISDVQNIDKIFRESASNFPNIEMGVHLHSTPYDADRKIEAAYNAGCRRMDGAILGIGGCPMAKDELTGNIAMERIVGFLERQKSAVNLDQEAWKQSLSAARTIFGKYH